jgi:hypothetical protein
MEDADRYRLLHGPYKAPNLNPGDRAICLFRDAEVVITDWSEGRIPWPLCRRLGRNGGNGLLVDEELARAVRSESRMAIRYWWGVSADAVYNWRVALGVGKYNEGTLQLVRARNAELKVRNRGRHWTPERHARWRQSMRKSGRSLRPSVPSGEPWTPAEVALLGTVPDADLAPRLGRPVAAVRLKRNKLGIPPACDLHREENRT